MCSRYKGWSEALAYAKSSICGGQSYGFNDLNLECKLSMFEALLTLSFNKINCNVMIRICLSKGMGRGRLNCIEDIFDIVIL